MQGNRVAPLIWRRMLDEGRPFNEFDRALSRSIRREQRMRNRQCFQNAQKLAAEGFSYVEGFALSVIPIEHAWVERPDRPGIVVDPTWATVKLDDVDYFGIAIPLDFVMRCQRITGYYAPVLKAWLLRDHPDFERDLPRFLRM